MSNSTAQAAPPIPHDSSTEQLGTSAAPVNPERVGKPRSLRVPAALAVIVAVGALLRVVPLRSVWLDEAISIGQARLPYLTMLHDLRSADVHPPLWGSVLWLDIRLFGDGPLAVRIPSLVIGTLSIPLVYLAARELYDRRAGVAAALLIAVSPVAVWYSAEARMYAFYIFWSLLAVLGQARAIRRGGWLDWGLFAVASAGLVYTHYFSLLQLCTQHLVFAAIVIRRGLKREQMARRLLVGWLSATVVTLVLLLPLVPYAGEQVGDFIGSSAGAAGSSTPTGGDGSRFISLYVILANLTWAMWGYHSDAAMEQLVALWPVGMLVILLLLGRGRSRSTALLVSLVIVPFALAYLLGTKQRSFFELRYFISVLPPLLILAARAATGWLRTTTARATAVAAIALTMIVGLGDQQLNSSNPRLYDYNGAFRLVNEEARPGDVILFAPGYLEVLVRYYHPAVTAVPIRGGVPLPAQHGGRTFLMASYLDNPDNASLVGQALAQLDTGGRTVQRVEHRENVTIWILQ
ncbi:glycosyltransferase family 39 protein [Dactylosporangium sp. NPDC000521]|uniref:glycosyltransferase family 39 protein n=1 Tax=Dactylosporangium sp. NPDC000521 TaxID=3363975 RepID=UPI00369F4CFA